MLNKKVCFSESLDSLKKECCTTVSELLNNKSLYIMLERFCNVRSQEDTEFNSFLNIYFNDEGYVDVWRIPHLLMDLVTGNCKFHSDLLIDIVFRTKFLSFVGEFYTYCVKNSELFLMNKDCLALYEASILEIRKNQCIFNLISETYCKVIEKLKSYGEVTQ